MQGDALRVNLESYRALVIPASEVLPARLVDRLYALADSGLCLIFLDRFPARTTGQTLCLALLSQHRNVRIVPVEQLVGYARELGFFEIIPADYQPDADVWMFTNDHPIYTVDTKITIPGSQTLTVYDLFTNQVNRLDSIKDGDQVSFPVRLEPYQSLFVIADSTAVPAAAAPPNRIENIPGPWSISTSTSEQYPAFSIYRVDAPLTDLSQPCWISVKFMKQPRSESMESMPVFVSARRTGML
jgi:hypothetical protein